MEASVTEDLNSVYLRIQRCDSNGRPRRLCEDEIELYNNEAPPCLSCSQHSAPLSESDHAVSRHAEEDSFI